MSPKGNKIRGIDSIEARARKIRTDILSSSNRIVAKYHEKAKRAQGKETSLQTTKLNTYDIIA